jgi:dUTP pyrophosphatase
VYAYLPEGGLVLGPDPVRVATGIALEIPHGYDAQVRPRSGLSLKGVGVALGTIDSDYRGEVLVTMWAFGSKQEHALEHGDRIAQLVIATLASFALEVVDELSVSTRGIGGHGSTGR